MNGQIIFFQWNTKWSYNLDSPHFHRTPSLVIYISVLILTHFRLQVILIRYDKNNKRYLNYLSSVPRTVTKTVGKKDRKSNLCFMQMNYPNYETWVTYGQGNVLSYHRIEEFKRFSQNTNNLSDWFSLAETRPGKFQKL